MSMVDIRNLCLFFWAAMTVIPIVATLIMGALIAADNQLIVIISSVELAFVIILGIPASTRTALSWILGISFCFNLVFSVRCFLGYSGCEIECREVYIELATAILFIISIVSFIILQLIWRTRPKVDAVAYSGHSYRLTRLTGPGIAVI